MIEVVSTYPRDDSFKVDTTTTDFCLFPPITLVVLNSLTCMQASRKLCELIKDGVAGIFGPVSEKFSVPKRVIGSLPL